MFHAILSTTPGQYAVLDTHSERVVADHLTEAKAHSTALRMTATRMFEAASPYPTGPSCPRSLCSGPCGCRGEM